MGKVLANNEVYNIQELSVNIDVQSQDIKIKRDELVLSESQIKGRRLIK